MLHDVKMDCDLHNDGDVPMRSIVTIELTAI